MGQGRGRRPPRPCADTGSKGLERPLLEIVCSRLASGRRWATMALWHVARPGHSPSRLRRLHGSKSKTFDVPFEAHG